MLHFVGGALVGSAPQQAYGPFLEGVSDAAGVCIVGTPCTGLETGLDHWQAASEVMLRWSAATTDLDAMLAAREQPPLAQLPVFGCGHSLGAKILLLLGSDARLAEAIGPRRANVLLSFNNFPARQSVPLLEQAVGLGKDSGPVGALARFGAQNAAAVLAGNAGLGEALGAGASSGLRGAASAVRQGDFGERLSSGLGALGVGGVSGGGVASDLAGGLDQLASGLGWASELLGATSQRAAEAAAPASTGGLPLDDEFTPGPAETDEAVRRRYGVGRNLLVRFADDGIDQSSGLARLLQSRFTDEVTGIGGRLDFRKLEGTHVTPNAPRLPSDAEIRRILSAAGMPLDLADAVGGIREVASKAARERETASKTVADFVQSETQKAREG